MGRWDEEQPKRHALTPIGDELQRGGGPVEPGESSRFESARRMLRRPKNRVGSVVYGLCLFALAVGVLAGVAHGVGLLLHRHSNLSHSLSLLVAFLLLGVIACLVAAGARNLLFGLAVGIALLVIGFGVWGRGTQELDEDPTNLAATVAPDWGRPSATCHRSEGRSSLCTVQGVEKSDRFQVCVTWRQEPGSLLVYSPLRRCGVDAAGITTPSLPTERYRASATAACVRAQPDTNVIVFQPIRVSPQNGATGLRVVVAFNPPQGVRSLADALFLRDAAAAKHFDGDATDQHRNVVIEWGNVRSTYKSRFNACLKP